MSLHPMVLATVESLRTHADLTAAALRHRLDATTDATPTGRSRRLTLAAELRAAEELAASWADVVAAVTMLAGLDAAVDETSDDDVSVSPTSAPLATPCDACTHTLNWHQGSGGCVAPRCVCSRFHDPEPQ